MEVFSYLLIICSIAGTLPKLSFASPDSRILYGTPVDTLKRFPHQVTITREVYGRTQYCGGSIISNEWIVTALNCVSNANFTVQFLLNHLQGTRKSFGISLDSSAVVPYPTGYDNIALIKLPVTLKFSQLLAPIRYNKIDEDYVSNSLVVMPGFSLNETSVLTYGMFKLLSPRQCLATYGEKYDKYLQICTVGWGNSKQMPCEGNEGGGLVSGWPQNPSLIGIFTEPTFCKEVIPAVYLKLSAYESWIDQTISNVFGQSETGSGSDSEPEP
ncbi:unnamed protein product [Hermetia illucens]|uniref:Peptidase S1 domain-containing protein n=1 Tax=Hermetia illucens TaxID=343691 RepID=A0A7R8YXQ9_HERIL|nr:trypsin 3A1-like [Hermetia illucens]CAD7088745.1 unnamed protein product [Hermetia illucens]